MEPTVADFAWDLQDLRAVVLLTERGHFGSAAEALGVSQPALTKRIRHLEERLGGPLFERGRRGARPTMAGRILHERALELLSGAERAERMTRGALAGLSGFLRIGAGMSSMLLGLPKALRVFRTRYPEVEVQVRDMSTQEQKEALRAGELDAGFVRLDHREEAAAADRDLHTERVLSDRLRLVCREDQSRDAALIDRETKLPLLWREPLVTISQSVSPTFREHVRDVCRAIRYSPPSVQEANQLLMVLMLVQSGMGIGLVPESVRELSFPGVRILDLYLTAASRWTIGLAWSKRGAAGNAILPRFAAVVRQSMGRRAPRV